MKKGKNRSNISLPSIRSEVQVGEDTNSAPLDLFTIKVLNLNLSEEETKRFAIKVTFFDQMLLTGIIKSTAVNIHPISSVESNISHSNSLNQITSHINANESESTEKKKNNNIRCCNIDILTLFLDKNKICLKKRMQPVFDIPLLQRKSWDNLPLLTMELSITKNKLNSHHYRILKEANYFKITLAASYNMIFPHDDDCIYTASSKTPCNNETNTHNVLFSHGHRASRRFDCTNFQPEWENIRLEDETYAKGADKYVCTIDDIQNEDNIDIKYYLKKEPSNYTTVWGSFHRTLMLGDSDQRLWEHLRQYHWPLEIQIVAGDRSSYKFMAFLNLTHLLYPGENLVKLAVPLQWANAEQMLAKCGCELMLTVNDKAPSTPGATQKPSKMTTESIPASTSNDVSLMRPTGADESNAFVILEVKFARPLKKIIIPPHINKNEIDEMLIEMEQGPSKRECTGRGQLDRDWQSTVRCAANSLRRVPYYGTTEFCTFNRQLSETRTHVELSTSCWQNAAIYVNNNFIVQEYVGRDEAFEEMLMMAHACLMRTACDTLVGVENSQNVDPTLRAARHARQMQDTAHAVELYLQLVVQRPRDSDCWRELGTCLIAVDKDWAQVCLNKSCVLDPRSPATLLSKAGMLFKEDPVAAEPFFVALLALHPFWTTAWVAASAYYYERELFHLSDKIMENTKRGFLGPEDPGHPRSWDRELGDWWDHTPILPGMSQYYDAADLLLRLRAVELAEVCVARALSEAGESAAYFHLVALCCRLKGNLADALCHLKLGLEKYGEISYLRSLEAECYMKQGDTSAAMGSFAKAGGCVGAYSILLSMPSRDPQRSRSVLVDLVRRQPSAYAWIALADDWMMKAAVGEGGDAGGTEEQVAAKTYAAACAIQALKWDRRAGRAWALLATLVNPSARRLHCTNMAVSCGYSMSEEKEVENSYRQSFCHRLGSALRECRCKWCQNLKL
ncbi:uncharacterized protein LOC115453164 isoform X2 [Manduca sexta]|uniref:uncharacterized protein LOC115453164 isoform X2 n=1 Tax=Manduca sexta TaxID=7130 RepID=UPI00188F58CF|nr:uncharacterized protein LOC115453164 isoform X2 [Manduca sexta]